MLNKSELLSFENFGECEFCGGTIVPIWFEKKEVIIRNGTMYSTGRVKNAVSHLECVECLRSYCVDDSFDEGWRNKR